MPILNWPIPLPIAIKTNTKPNAFSSDLLSRDFMFFQNFTLYYLCQIEWVKIFVNPWVCLQIAQTNTYEISYLNLLTLKYNSNQLALVIHYVIFYTFQKTYLPNSELKGELQFSTDLKRGSPPRLESCQM